MPKKKKKEKGGGEDEMPDPLAQSTTASKPGLTGGLSMSNSASIFNKTSLSSSIAGKSAFGTNKDNDPNMKLLGQNDLSEMERELEAHQKDETTGMGGGMGVFAINKDGISRAVAKFIEKPRPQPLTVSFHFPGTFLTHKYVMAIIRQHITNIPDACVTHVQYMDRNVRLGTRGLENRWLVTVRPLRAKEQLIRQGIKVVNRTIYVKSADDVNAEEYREYQRYSDLQNKMRMGFGAKSKKPGVPTPATAVSTGATTESTTVSEAVPEKIEEEPEEEAKEEEEGEENEGKEEEEGKEEDEGKEEGEGGGEEGEGNPAAEE